MSKKLYLPYSTGCFVCGCDNPHGLQTMFYVQDDKVHADLKLADYFNSYRNVAHGGVLSSVLDEAMGWAAFIFSDSKIFLFTRELTVTYKKNAPLDEPLLITTEFTGMEKGGVAAARGRLTDKDGKILTTSKGLFFPILPGKMEETKSYLRFDDSLKYHPKALEFCR